MKKNSNKKKAKKILFINPPRQEVIPKYFTQYNLRYSNPWLTFSQPAALLRMVTYFRKQGWEVAMIDAGSEYLGHQTPVYHQGQRQCGNFNKKKIFEPVFRVGMSNDDFKKVLKKEKSPQEIFITSSFTYQYEPIHDIIKICKHVFPQSKITLGGTYATLCPEHAKNSQADKIFEGEFKETNDLPADFEILKQKPHYSVIKFSRGCNQACSYCAVPLLEGRRISYRDFPNVLKEIKEKKKKYGINKIVFWESNPCHDAENNIEVLLDLLIQSKLNLEIFLPEGLSPAQLSLSLLYKMRKAGLKTITLALESSDNKILQKRFHKKHSMEDFKRCVKYVHQLNFSEVFVFILAGLPGENMRNIFDAVKRVEDEGFIPMLMPFTPIPKTEEYKKVFSRIKHKGLEDLHPLLWPCVESAVDYERLIKIYLYALNIKKNIGRF